MTEARTFVVRVEFDERTRWHLNDPDMADLFRHLIHTAVVMHTEGAEPLILVNVHSNSEEIRALAALNAALEKEGL